jgi:hypothetical protein
MKNITKSFKVMSLVIDLLLGSDYTPSVERSLADLKIRYLL